MNIVTLIGRLTRDPELRYTQSGQAVTRFTLAVDRGLSKAKRVEMEQKNMPTADFISCTAWGQTAELISNYLNKGRRLGVEGRIQTGSYEKDGNRVFTTDVVVNRIHFLDSMQQGGQRADFQDNTFKSDFSQPVNSAYNQSNFGSSDTEGFFPIDDEDIPF